MDARVKPGHDKRGRYGGMAYYVYILASGKNGTLYIGVTNDLTRRIWEHKSDTVAGFTRTYAVHDLVHFEEFPDVRDAIQREKNLKRWNRVWKIELIQKGNPDWRDLSDEIAGG